MAWLSNNAFSATDKLHAVDLNNLANDIRNWGGDVNGGGFNLYNCTISGVFTDPTTTVGDLIVHGPTAGTVGALQRLPIGTTDGLALVIDHTQTLGVKWGVAAQGMLDPTITKGDLIVKPSGAPPTRLPIGADSHILICDSSQTTGMRWGTITAYGAPGADQQVVLNQAGNVGASPNLVFNYSLGHLLVGGGADDGSAAVVQVTGITHTTMRIRSDMVFSPKAWPSSSSYVSPDAGYGGIGYQGSSIYWYWNGAAYAAVDFSRVAISMTDPTAVLGDLLVRGSSAVTRFPVGSNNYLLVADSTQPLGLRWQAPQAIGVTSAFGRTGTVIATTGDYTVSMVTNAVDATVAYANPTWITSLPWSKITAAPMFLVDPTTAKGDLITRTTAGSTRIVIGADGQLLTADSTQATGMKWASPSATYVTTISPGAFSGAVIFTAGSNVTLSQISNSSGQQIQISVPNINSSTGMADPTTTQGDLIVHGLTAGTTRMPVGTVGQILTVDTTSDFGIKWDAPADFVGVSSLSPGALVGAVSLIGGSNVLISQSAQNITIGVPNVMVDPTTTKGDLVVHGTATTRLGVGTDGQVLTADSTQVLGVKWTAAPAEAAVGSDQQILFNKAGITGASPNLLFDYTNGTLTLTGPANASMFAAQHLYTGAQPSAGCIWDSYVAHGTSAAPTPVQAGDRLADIRGWGYDGAANRYAAEIVMFAESNFTSGLGYGNIVFATNNGAASVVERMRISAAGLVGIGTPAPTEALDVSGHLRLRYVTGLGGGTWIDNSTAAEQCFVGLDAAINTWRVYSALASAGYDRFELNLDPAVAGTAKIVGDANSLTGTLGLAQLILTGSPATGNSNKTLWMGFDTTNNYGVVQAGITGTGWNSLLLNPSGGNVGVGTVAPTKLLHVAGNFGGFAGQIRAEALAAGNAAGIDFHATHVGTSAQEPEIQYADNSVGIDLYRKRLVISSFANSTAGTGSMGVAVSLQGGSEGTQDFRITNGNNLASTMFTVSQSGNVGIGTTAPGAPLHIAGAASTNNYYANGDPIGGTLYVQDSSNAANAGGQILFGSGFGVFGMIKGMLQNATGPAGDLIFGTRASSGNVLERMRVQNTGNIGIGTSTPGVALDVIGTIRASTQVAITNTSAAAAFVNTGYAPYFELQNAASTMQLQIGLATFNGSFALNAGDMIIGGTGSARGNIHITSNYGGGGALTNLILQENGGLVGIGTAAPTSKLQVAGLATYATDAAAGTAGLTSGAFYLDSTGVVHAKL
jgi:hypothetical protein